MRSLSMLRPFSLAAATLLVLACGSKSNDPAESEGSDSNSSSDGTDSGTSDASASATASASDSNSGGTTTSPTSAGTSTSASASGGTDSSGGSSGGGFIEPPDGGVVGQCDPGLQDCPNADEKCTAYATMPGTCCVDANKCVPVTGTGVAGDDCIREMENDDCAAGFFCTTQTSGSTGEGFCEQLCIAGDDTSCDEGTCIVYNDGVLPLCRVECDPLLQDCSNQGFGCYPAQDTFVCGKPANNDGEGGDGSVCTTLRSCLPGLACVTGTATAGCAADGVCCTPFCDLSGPDPCMDPAEDCVAWFTQGNAPPQYADVGACLIPA